MSIIAAIEKRLKEDGLTVTGVRFDYDHLDIGSFNERSTWNISVTGYGNNAEIDIGTPMQVEGIDPITHRPCTAMLASYNKSWSNGFEHSLEFVLAVAQNG